MDLFWNSVNATDYKVDEVLQGVDSEFGILDRIWIDSTNGQGRVMHTRVGAICAG